MSMSRPDTDPVQLELALDVVLRAGEQYKAERDRYREALELIADLSMYLPATTAAQIAIEALNPPVK
jgi:hypothetical protein